MPVSLSADDTQLHPALRPYQDGSGFWRIAGVHGDVPKFTTYEELTQELSRHHKNKADKVGLFSSSLSR